MKKVLPPRRRTLTLPSALACGALLQLATSPAWAQNQGFVLQDYVGRNWQNECVRFPMNGADLQSARAGKALLSPDGKQTPYQVVRGSKAGTWAIAFMADLGAYQKANYHFSNKNESKSSDLKIEETGDTIRLTNSRTGISIRKKLEGSQSPIESIRLLSGKWVGSSTLKSDEPVTAYTASITARGPAYAEVYCRVEWGANQWHLRFRLEANEPVVTVNETMALGDKSANFSLNLSDNFAPDKILYRYGQDNSTGAMGKNATGDIKPGNVFILEPWLHWWVQQNEGPVFSVYNETGNDLLSIGAAEAGSWVDPTIPAEKRTAPEARATQDESGLHLNFILKNGGRKWIISALDKDECLSVLKDPNLLYSPSLPHQYLIKHGQFPLDSVKDYVLDWGNTKDSYPHLLVSKAQIQKIRATSPALTESIINGVLAAKPVTQFNLENALSAYFAGDNEKVGKFLTGQAQDTMREAVDTFLQQPYVPYGAAPHHQQVLGTAPLLLDAVLDSNYTTSEERKKLLAQAAFCCYAINRADYWSEERGYAANPNMTTSVLGYRVALGSLMPSHPNAKAWVNDALSGLKQQLYGWSDANGGWLEAPHYAMVSYDAILGSFLMAHNAGISELVYDPQMKKVINWFGNISTPKDFRFSNFRHLPPIGNTCISEPSGEFGILAAIWKDRDPQFAGEMQWMFNQQKSWGYPGVGGGYPTLGGYRKFLLDPTVPEKMPKWTSVLYPNVNVILRSGFQTDRETHLDLLSGSFGGWRSHWDADSGSFTLWGKGRILADDFGYYGQAPAEDHNMLATSVYTQAMETKEFTAGTDFDYVCSGQPRGQRQIAFVKDTDPLAPNYYMVCDTLRVSAPATWRLWLTANKVSPTSNGATVEGKEDVDMDVFFPQPAVDVKTEDKSRTAISGIRPDGSGGEVTTTQTGLIVNSPRMNSFATVLYPRLETEKPPVFTPLAGGKAVKVESPAGTDYVFLSGTPFTFDEGNIHFEGTAGMVKIRGDKTTVALGSDGNISANGQKLAKGNPNPTKIPVVPFNQIMGGDFENGQQNILFPTPPEAVGAVSLFDGNPVAGDTADNKHSLAVTFSKDAGVTLASPVQLFVDPQKTYKFSVRVYSPQKLYGDLGGYVYNLQNEMLKLPNGQYWTFGLELKGPTNGWETFSTTIGPPGSGANTTWPEDALRTGFAIWPKSEKGTFYMDDFRFEELPAKPKE